MFNRNLEIKRTCEESKTPKPGNLLFSPFKVTSPLQHGIKIDKKPEIKGKLSNRSLNFSEFVKDFGILGEDSTRTERIVEFQAGFVEEKERVGGAKYFDVTKSKQNTSRHKKNAQSVSINFNNVLKLKKTISAQHSKERIVNKLERSEENTTKVLTKSKKTKEKPDFCLDTIQDFFQVVKKVYKSLKYKKFVSNSGIKEDLLGSDKNLGKKSGMKGRILEYLGKIFDQFDKASEKVVKIEKYSVLSLKPITFIQTIELNIQPQNTINLLPIKNSDTNLKFSEETLSFLSAQNAELQLLIDKGKSDYSSLLSQQKSLKSSERFLQDNILMLREENLLLETELKNLKTTIGGLSNSLSKVTQKNSQQKKLISELVKMIKDFQKHDNRTFKYPFIITKKTGSITETSKNPNENTEKIGSIKETGQTNSELNENLEILQSECRRLSNENQELRCTNEKNKKCLHELSSENMRLEKENVCIKEENKLFTKSLSETKNEKSRIQACLEQLQESINDLKVENLAYKETVEILEKHCSLDSI